MTAFLILFFGAWFFLGPYGAGAVFAAGVLFVLFAHEPQ